MDSLQNSRAIQRVQGDLNQMRWGAPSGIQLWAVADNLLSLEAIVEGPDGTPYEGGEFHISITIPEQYPIFPPTMRFITKIFHPNIDQTGLVCLESLKAPPKGCWSPTTTLEGVLLQIQQMMRTPNFDDPLDAEAASLHKRDPEAFVREARKQTQELALKKTVSAGIVSHPVDSDESD